MWARIALTFMAIVVFPSIVLAQEWEDELAGILKRLDSDCQQERAAAEKTLEKLCEKVGYPIVAVLKEHLGDASPQSKHSISTQLSKIPEYQHIFSLLDILNHPNMAGKKFIICNTGGYHVIGWPGSLSFAYANGWVLSESEEEITILENTLVTRTYRKERSLPKNWDYYKKEHPKDKPLPGCYNVLDFEKFCRNFIKAGVVDYYGRWFDHYPRGGRGHATEAAIYAYWAFRLGLRKESADLMELATKSHQSHFRSHSLLEQVTAEIVTNIRWQAITGANSGKPRPEVLKMWQLAVRLTGGKSEESRQMVRLYEEMISEDEKWVEPKEDDIKKMSDAEKTSYWMYKLRDAAATQGGQPGSCYAFGRYSGHRGSQNPADKLYELGWSAIPTLIEHLDDPRPTRCMGYYRNFSLGSFYLLRYGDCCQQIFKAVTGIQLTRFSPIFTSITEEGKAPKCKQEAGKWWSKYKNGGPEKYYLSLLGNKDIQKHAFAAFKLLELDNSKYLPNIIGVAKRDRAGGNCRILYAIVPYLGKDDEAFLKGYLSVDNLMAVVVAADTLLEKCQSDIGAKEIIVRLKNFTSKQRCSYPFFLGEALDLLSKVPKEYVFEAIPELMRHNLRDIRCYTLWLADKFVSRQVLDALILMLDKKETEDELTTAKDAKRFCDDAAHTIAEMVAYPKEYNWYWTNKQKDSYIRDLKAWLKANIDKLDWDALRLRAEEKRKAKKN